MAGHNRSVIPSTQLVEARHRFGTVPRFQSGVQPPLQPPLLAKFGEGDLGLFRLFHGFYEGRGGVGDGGK